jgi:Carboxypeptidase regulatory-like domain
MFKPGIISLLFVASLTACPAESTPAGKNTISGRALDARGKPVAGALVWVKPALTTGLVTAHTDANGQYRVTGLLEIPYKVYAWAQPEFSGKRQCLRLGHDQLADYDSVVPSQAVVRDFRWKLEGLIADRGAETFFGGELRLMPVYRHDHDFDIHDNLKIELKLEPTGALVDGSTGKTIIRTLNWNDTSLATDIPLGSYQVTATQIAQDGTRSELEVGPNETSLSTQSGLSFKAISGACGGNFGNGTERAFVSIARP